MKLFNVVIPVVGVLLMVSSSWATLLLPTDVTFVTSPPGSNDPSNLEPPGPYRDDVFLESITFDGFTFSENSGQIVAVQSAYVTANRQNVNAEFGDNDTNSDGNPDPFTRVGLDPIKDRESTVPKIQDTALASAFSTLSLNEGIDGEPASGPNQYKFELVFQAGISDNNVGADNLPEIILFERGDNDTSVIRAITGGTFMNPTYADQSVTLQNGDFFDIGIQIDTREINQGQDLTAVGIDLSDFFSNYQGETVWGIEIESTGGDFYGKMVSAEDPLVQLDFDVPEPLINPNGVIPEPTSLILLSLGAASLLMRRR